MEETTQTPEITTRSAGIRYGIVLAIVSFAYFIVLTISGVAAGQGIWSWVGYLITAGLIFLAQKYFKDNGNGFMTYGQGIGIAFWEGLVSIAIYMPLFYIYIKFIDSGFIEMIKEKQIDGMQQKGMSDEQIDQAMKIAGAFMTPEAMLGFGIVFGIIGTIIIGLIVTIFTQKKNSDPFA
ncbi:MAG: Twin-arginine translocation protein TatC [Cytophagales bacterium]|jgi:hypothetical protein|nr:DUF4199 domain-containing protein [Bacteroidota bacterium]MBS1980535.1 DUF4199 domain-containing protein [Bacteroidota bacterium]WHZ07854.1 MAG: Twin-arginine translocation protein TatC [Cytophagales bacterium]